MKPAAAGTAGCLNYHSEGREGLNSGSPAETEKLRVRLTARPGEHGGFAI